MDHSPPTFETDNIITIWRLFSRYFLWRWKMLYQILRKLPENYPETCYPKNKSGIFFFMYHNPLPTTRISHHIGLKLSHPLLIPRPVIPDVPTELENDHASNSSYKTTELRHQPASTVFRTTVILDELASLRELLAIHWIWMC